MITKRVLLGGLIAMNLTMVGQTAESPKDPQGGSFRVGIPRCEYRVNPLGIQTPTPQFGWILESTTVGTCQTAYRIVVASSQADLARQTGDLWDSGKIKSPQNLYIPYHGSILKPLTKYYWQVGVWNQDDVLQWSQPQTFVMGKLTASDWRGNWIESGQETKNAIYMRKTFPIAKPIANAYLSICGLGGADVYINGQRVSEEMAITSPSNFPRKTDQGRSRSYSAGYSTYDATRFLRDGDNCIGVILGNAFYHSGSWLKQYDIGQVKMICDLVVTFSDTTTTTVVSDATWTWSYGAIKTHDLSQEDLDMRDRMPGWNTTGFNGPAWSSVKLLSPQLPKEILRSRQEPPIVVYKTTQLTADKNSSYKFPEFLVGHVRFDASGTNGAIINVGGSKFILSGDGVEKYQQRFGFHGMTGTGIKSETKGVVISNVSFVSTATGVDVTGRFSCNDAIIQQLVTAGYNTGRMQTMGALGLETREKAGWGEDGRNALLVNIFAADMLTIGRKWMWDFLDRQEASGYIPSVIPGDFGGENGIWQGGALNYVAWELYQQYGDKRILEEAYSGMKKTMEFLASKSDPKHFTSYTLGDWLNPIGATKSYPHHGTPPPAVMTGTVQYYDYARKMEQVASILGITKDAIQYRDLATAIKTNYNKDFWDDQAGVYKDSTGGVYQSSQAMAAWYGMVPDGKYDLCVKHLSEMVISNQYHPSTGFTGTPPLLGLMMRDYPDVAYAMLHMKDAPSFLSNIADGVCSENWVALRGSRGLGSMNGHFNRHVYQILAGIHPLEPGFKKNRHSPSADDRIDRGGLFL
ncbi:MAG: alpha-L-rhamnosidase N-terminal domain-containing protein [bacterium]